MPGTPAAPTTPSADTSRRVLDFVHSLLRAPAGDQPGLEALLRGLADAFDAPGAGVACLADGRPGAGGRGGGGDGPWPWEGAPELVARACRAPAAVTSRAAGGGDLLLAAAQAGQAGWLLWLEGAGREWADSEAA